MMPLFQHQQRGIYRHVRIEATMDIFRKESFIKPADPAETKQSRFLQVFLMKLRNSAEGGKKRTGAVNTDVTDPAVHHNDFNYWLFIHFPASLRIVCHSFRV